jgi:hypothetical protein
MNVILFTASAAGKVHTEFVVPLVPMSLIDVVVVSIATDQFDPHAHIALVAVNVVGFNQMLVSAVRFA